MLVIVGMIVVFSAVVGGYLLEHGNLSVLFQPVELLIIGGAAIGAFMISNPPRSSKPLWAPSRILLLASPTRNRTMSMP